MVIMIITKATDIVIIMMPAIGICAAAVKHKNSTGDQHNNTYGYLFHSLLPNFIQ